MNQNDLYPIGPLSVIDVAGADASAIVHNVTTNEVHSLELGDGHESFVTDVRGKTLGHVVVFRIDNRLRLIGPEGQSDRIAEHLDRYTIREDATPTVRDSEYVGVVLSPGLLSSGLLSSRLMASGFSGKSPETAVDVIPLRHVRLPVGDVTAELYECRWLGERAGLLLVAPDELEGVIKTLEKECEATVGDITSFHAARIRARFPWYGVDLTDANLPQEADRDSAAVSFTKGCYLGQETVARLDAMGQVQKKLVAWSIGGGIPAAGTLLQAGEKTVGRLTSVADNGQGGAIALGPARRSHFEPGSEANCLDEANAKLVATVI